MKDRITLSGVIQLDIVNKGSKSEHESAVLKTDDGTVVALKMKGANPFGISGALKQLVGSRAAVTGDLAGSALYITDLSDVEIAPRRAGGPPPPPEM